MGRLGGWEFATAGLQILGKALFNFAASLGHVFTDFLGLRGSVGSAGWMPYHLFYDFGGLRN